MGKSTGKIIEALYVPNYPERFVVTDKKTGKILLVTSDYRVALAELYKQENKVILFPKKTASSN